MNPFVGRTRATIAGALLLAGGLGGGLTAATAAPAGKACVHRVLVLSAMPLELNPLMAKATINPADTVRVNGRSFYVGRLAGHDVVLAMTGIGLVNAERTATLAFEHFRCAFAGAVFSGVAGSRYNIGDVVVPKRWTRDNGKTWTGVDPGMLAVARRFQGTKVKLSQDVPVGDAACLCPGVDAATPVHMPQKLKVVVGGDGMSYDTYGDHALPCLPGGGDVAGCEPCVVVGNTPQNAATFVTAFKDIAEPSFFTAFFQPPAATTTTMDSQDEETAAVAQVAHRYGVRFLGIRGVSDGTGDPLHLPGFPFQFFVYRQISGNNAAAVTLAFLTAWHGR